MRGRRLVNAENALSSDYLSDLFDNLRCESLSVFVARYAAPWRLDFPGQIETCGYFMQEGAATLEAAGTAYELRTGDLALVLQGTAHCLYSRAGDAPAAVGHCIQRFDRARAATAEIAAAGVGCAARTVKYRRGCGRSRA